MYLTNENIKSAEKQIKIKKNVVSLLLRWLFLHIFACDIIEAFISGRLIIRSRFFEQICKFWKRLCHTLQLAIILLAQSTLKNENFKNNSLLIHGVAIRL